MTRLAGLALEGASCFTGALERGNMKRSAPALLALLVLLLTISLPAANAQTNESPAATDKASQKNEANALKWKEKILKVPVGSYIKAKLESQAEYEGQLRDISDSDFTIQVLKGKQIETVAIQYQDMKSLSVSGRPGKGEKIAKSILFSTI
jgi:hypothetical protein